MQSPSKSSDLPEEERAFGVRSITVAYGGTPVLNNVSVNFAPGVTALLGKNGAGKSTLCRVLAGAEAPDAGSFLAPQGSGFSKTDRRYRRRVGWLPQNAPVLDFMKVHESIRYAAWLKGISRKAIESAVSDALERTGLTAKEDDRVGNLSGGMVRRLGIAQAIVHEPELLILDEPTTGLDPEQRQKFYETLKAALSPETVTVLSTHIFEDVIELGQNAVILDRGTVMFTGRLKELLAVSSEEDVTRRLGDAFSVYTSQDVEAGR